MTDVVIEGVSEGGSMILLRVPRPDTLEVTLGDTIKGYPVLAILPSPSAWAAAGLVWVEIDQHTVDLVTPGQVVALSTPPSDPAHILNELCVKLGFCLPPQSRKTIVNNPPLTVGEFAAAVYAAENLTPPLRRPPEDADPRPTLGADPGTWNEVTRLIGRLW